jgi:hypothetical protein
VHDNRFSVSFEDGPFSYSLQSLADLANCLKAHRHRRYALTVYLHVRFSDFQPAGPTTDSQEPCRQSAYKPSGPAHKLSGPVLPIA